MQCDEKAGFLFSHDCSHPAQWACGSCNKNVCEKHAHRRNAQTLCTSCVKKAERHADRHAGKGRGTHVDDDPFLYTTYYYYGYGYYGRGSWGWDSYNEHSDASDFTEADGMSLMAAGDEAWEQDMGAS